MIPSEKQDSFIPDSFCNVPNKNDLYVGTGAATTTSLCIDVYRYASFFVVVCLIGLEKMHVPTVPTITVLYSQHIFQVLRSLPQVKS